MRSPMIRRSPLLRVVTITLSAAALTGLAGCDTGDGKRLRAVDPDATTTSTTATEATIGSGAPGDSIEIDPLASVPLGGDSLGTVDGTAADALELYTPWIAGGPIDQRYTCDGEDISPPLSWTVPPEGTVQLAFAMVDESTIIEGRPFLHWALLGVDPAEVSLLEGDVPTDAVQAENAFGTIGWSGPCPPEGGPEHSYRFTMYALNQQVELADGTSADEFLDYIQMVTIASTDVTATYRR